MMICKVGKEEKKRNKQGSFFILVCLFRGLVWFEAKSGVASGKSFAVFFFYICKSPFAAGPLVVVPPFLRFLPCVSRCVS